MEWCMWQRRRALCAAAWVALLVALLVGPTRAADLASQEQMLDVIGGFADRLCSNVALEGSATEKELSGKASVELNNLLSKLAGLGLEVAASDKRSQYEGLLREDLASALKDELKCKTDVLMALKDKLLLGPDSRGKPAPVPDLSGGTRRVYSANFQEWPVNNSEHGTVGPEYGTYLMSPSGNTWVGPGRPVGMVALKGDFVFELSFLIKNRTGPAALSLNLTGAGADADRVSAYLMWSASNLTYSVSKERLKDRFYVTPVETVAEAVPVPPSLASRDWSRATTLTLKREGGEMHLFIGGQLIRSFGVSLFEPVELGVSAAHPSPIMLTSVEARQRP